MSATIVLGPRDRLVQAVADQILAGQTDLSKVAVVFPGKRPAHFLRRELAHRINASYIPPRVFAIEDFIDYINAKLPAGPVPNLEPLDAVAVLFELHTNFTERLGGDAFRSLDSFLPIGLKLFGELEELRLAGLDERTVVQALESISFDQRHTLAAYYREFYVRAATLGYSTRAMRYAEAADRLPTLPIDEFERIIIAGIFKLTRTEERIIDELRRRDQTLFILQSDKPQAGDERPTIALTSAPDVHGQVFALAAKLREQLERPEQLDERTVIVLPAPDALFPLVQHALSGIPEDRYNIAFGYPLARTPIYGFLTVLLDLIRTRQSGRFASHAYVTFILHPYTKNIRLNGRSDVTRILMHTLERVLAGDRSRLLVRLEELEQEDEVFAQVAYAASSDGEPVTAEEVRAHLCTIHDRTIRPLEDLTSVRALARAVSNILTTIYETSTAPMHPLFRPYAETVLEAFARLEHSLIGNASFDSVEGYIECVRHIVDQLTVPFPGTPLRGLQVLGILETRCLQFDHVYVLQVTDDLLPGGACSDMLLPQRVRESLGLETVRQRDELSEHYFRLLVGGAQSVDLFFSESGGASKSRFVEKLLWEQQKLDGEYRSSPYIRTVQYELRLADEIPSPVTKSAEVLAATRRLSYSASALDSYLRCPLQFYYRYVLRLRESEEIAEDVDMREVGVFVHDVLRTYFEPYVGVELPPESLDPNLMDAVVEKKFDERYSSEPAGALYLLKRQVRARMREFLTRYQGGVCGRTPVHILGLEERLSANTFGHTLTGTVDRIEQRGGRTVIVDYKSGTDGLGTAIRIGRVDLNDRSSWEKAIGSLQLPFYMLLVTEAWHLDPAAVEPVYVFLGDPDLGPDSEVGLAGDNAERVRRFGILRSVIERLLTEINDASLAYVPTTDLAKRCPRCPFTGICGTQWVQSGSNG